MMKKIVLHPYELEALAHGKLTRIRRPVEPQPEHRWNGELHGDKLHVCRGEHEKCCACTYEPYAHSPFGKKGDEVFVGYLSDSPGPIVVDIVDLDVQRLLDADVDKLFNEGCPDHYRNVGKHKPRAWLKRTWDECYPEHPSDINPHCWVVTVKSA